MQIGSYDFLDSYFNSTLFNPNFGRPLIFQPANPNVQLYNIQMLLTTYFLLHPEYSKALSRIAGGSYKCTSNICRLEKSQLFSVYHDYKQYRELQDVYLYGIIPVQRSTTTIYIEQTETNSIADELITEVWLRESKQSGDRIYTLHNSNGDVIARVLYINNTGEIKFIQFNRQLVIELAQKLLDKYGMNLLKYVSFPIPVNNKEAQIIPFTRFYQDVYLQYYLTVNIEQVSEFSSRFMVESIPIYVYTPVGDSEGEIVNYPYKELRNKEDLLEILPSYLARLLNQKGLLPTRDMSQYGHELAHLCRAYIGYKLSGIDLHQPFVIDRLVNYCTRIAIILRVLLNSEK